MKTFKLIVILFILATRVMGQSVGYRYLQNDPYRYNFNINLRLFDAEYAAKQSVFLGYGLQGSLAIKKLVTAEFLFDRPYAPAFDMNYHFATKTPYTIVTTNMPKAYNQLEAGGMFHLLDRVSSKKRRVTLSTSTSSRGRRTYSETNYIRVPADVRTIFGIRGGLYHNTFAITDQHHGTVTGGVAGVGDGGVVADDGTAFGAAVSDYNSPFYNTVAVSNMNVNGFYAGICKAEYVNISLSVDGYGTKSNRTYLRLYADVILAPPVVEDFHGVNGRDYKIQGGSAKGFETRPLGFRVGYDAIKFGKAVAFYGRTELGVKPGLKRSSFYLSVGFGISIREKIKVLAGG